MIKNDGEETTGKGQEVARGSVRLLPNGGKTAQDFQSGKNKQICAEGGKRNGAGEAALEQEQNRGLQACRGLNR